MASIAPPASDKSSSGRTTRIVVGIVVLLVGGVALLSTLTSGNRQEATDTYTGVATLELDLRNGPVVVSATDSDDVVVEKSFTTGFLGGTTRAEQDGDILRLTQRCPFFIGFGCRSSYTVTVPAGIAITGSTSNGSIRIEGIDGRIDVETSNGAVDLDAVTSTVSARTSNGAITGTGLLSAEINVSTSNGRISLEFEDAPSSLAANTSNGAIEVVLPADAPAYAISTSTSNGDVQNSIRADPAAEASIDLGTSNGDISLRYSD